MTTRFSDCAPGEELILTFDFANGLDGAETLTVVDSVTVAVDYGADPDAAALVQSSAISGETVLVSVADMVANTDYRITVLCTTSNAAKTLAVAGILPCRRA